MRFCILVSVIMFCGCATVNVAKRSENPAFLHVPPELPRELQKTTLPDYVIEPPDILRIEVARVIPVSPYILGAGDGLLVQVARADGTVVLSEVFRVELDGTLQLGSPFDDIGEAIGSETPISEPGGESPKIATDGPVSVAGLSIQDARQLISSHIAKTISKPSVRISLSEFAAQQAISGEHLVGPDGTVNLGVYGRVQVTGLTIDEARARINEQLSIYLQAPNATVDVFSYNSKNYYIVLQGAGMGDRVMQFPVTGNETVLDALSNVEGLSGTSSEEIWISRPGHNGFDGPQVLPVNWGAITQLADTTSNYQIMPGDRVFVREDSLIAIDTHLGKLISPIERVLGVVLLGTNTSSRIQFYKQFGQRGGGVVTP